jgi:hypothetical protein
MIETLSREQLEDRATALTATIAELRDELEAVNDALDATNVDAHTWGGRRGAPFSADGGRRTA